MYTIIKKCRICSSGHLINVLNLGSQSLANNFLKKRYKQKKIPLKLLICASCKVVQISANVNPKKLFSKYFWVTSTSSKAKEFSSKFVKNLLKKMKKPNYVLEIASNDGLFLKKFKSKKIKVLGVEPAKNLSKIANEEKIKTLNKFFSLKTARFIEKKYQKPDIIFGRNVIAHVKNIKSVIQGMRNLISEKGIVAIEFHYARNILKQLQYDSIYHEHLFYFSAFTIINSFKQFGLFAFDISKSPISGGALIIFFSKIKKKPSEKLKKILKEEKILKINNVNHWQLFGKKCLDHSKKLKNKILSLANDKNSLIGYGASARSSTLLNFMKINDNHISKIIDLNKLKQGMYTSGNNIPIVPIENINKNSNIIILAWNFLKEIKKFLKKKKFKGKILVPLPNKSYYLK